jgi:hypothetical protein
MYDNIKPDMTRNIPLWKEWEWVLVTS